MGIATFLFVSLAQVIIYFKTGAKKETQNLVSARDIEDHYRPKVNWSDISTAEGRPMEPKTIDKITTDYLAGEFYHQEFLLAGNLKGIHDYFTEKPREHLVQLASHSQTAGVQHQSTGLEHHFSLRFYSEDGTLVVLEDRSIAYQQIYEDTLVVDAYDSAVYDVMLLLEDNFWRVRHKVRRQLDSKATKPTTDAPASITIRGKEFIKDGKKFKIKGINYYPQKYPWSMMWSNIDRVNIDDDFKKIKELGVNTIRVFVPYTEFGQADVSTNKLSELTGLMNAAHDNDLHVIVTLFDFFLEYDVSRWTLSDRHAEQVVNHLKDHPALLGWDLKNEPDLDFEIHGKTKVVKWLEFIAGRIKGYDPEHLVTIGWSQPEVSNTLENTVDFTSFHFFRPPGELQVYLKNNSSNFKTPQFLGETGMHSYDAWWFPFGKTEKDQYNYLKEVLATTKEYQLNYAIWTLYDFRRIPKNVAGSALWKRNPQKKYGLINAKNEHKPAYELLLKFNHDQ